MKQCDLMNLMKLKPIRRIEMTSSKRLLAGCGLVLLACSASATVSDVVHSAAAGASAVASKVERGVKTGVNAGLSGVERGTKAAGRAVESGAKKIGIPGAGASA